MDQQVPAWRSMTGASALGALALAACSLLSWWWPALRPDAWPVPSTPLASALLALAALALWLQRAPATRPGVGRAVALLVVVSGIAGVVLAARARTLGEAAPVALNVAKNISLLGLALLCLDWTPRRFARPSELLAFLLVLIAFLALLARVYGIDLGDRRTHFMPPLTAGAFLLLALGVLWARPAQGVMAAIAGGHDAGHTARRALLVIALVMVVLGWLRLQGERRGLYDADVGVTLYTFAFIASLAALVIWNARTLHRADARRRRAEDAIRALNAELEDKALALTRANAELEAFSYSISHDLRAPLRHIDGYARMLQEDAGPALEADSRRQLDVISDSARHMGMLIDDLLAFSRLGRKPLERARVDMRALAEAALAEAGAGRNPAQVVIAPMPEAWCDPVLLRQVWVNLLSNACKYSAPRGGEARIEAGGRREGGRLHYFVRDNGVGFDMRYAEKLFGVFQRLHAAEEFEGTGVGLAIVQRIVARHGGEVGFTAAPGAGATFTFTLPDAPDGEIPA